MKNPKPGDHIKELLEEKGMNDVDLALHMRSDISVVREVLAGHHPINNEIAEQLQEALGVPMHFWLNLQFNYEKRHIASNHHKDVKEIAKDYKTLALEGTRTISQLRETLIPLVSAAAKREGTDQVLTHDDLVLQAGRTLNML